MKRLINVRVPLFCAVGLILGIIACKELLCGDFYFGLILLVLLAAGIVVGLVIKRARLAFALLLICAFVGFGLAQLSFLLMEGDEVIGRSVELQGRVCDLKQNGAATNVYYLEDCVDATSGEHFRGKVKLVYYAFDGDELAVGEVVTLRATMHSTYPVKTSVSSFYVRNHVYYELVDIELVDRAEGGLKFDEKVRRYIYDIAMEYSPNNAGIIYALLTGDRNAIDDNAREDFTRAGTVHVLAVSGLHVGFIVALMAFALRAFKLKPLVECGIILLPLSFYAYICGFSPSVTRAVVMTVCAYLARVAHGRYDLLTSMSTAAIIIIFPTPYSIFDVGFQLSFLSVFGIATLHATIMGAINKRKLNKIVMYLFNTFFLSLSCSLATFLTLAANFSQVPILGVFVNIIVIPFIALVFVMSMFGMIPWLFHYLVAGADKLLDAVAWLNSKVSSLSFSSVSITALAIAAAIFALLLFVVGGFVNLNKIGKRITCSVCALLLVASVLIATIPSKTDNRVYVSYGYSGTVIASTADNGEAAIVGELTDNSATANAVRFLDKCRINSCTLFATDFPTINDSPQFILDLPINKAYALTLDAYNKMAAAFDGYDVPVVFLPPNSFVDGAISIRSIYNGALAAVTVRVGSIDLCYALGNGDIPACQLATADVYALAHGVDVSPYSQSQVTTFSRYQTFFEHNYGANKYGNFTITEKDDKIIFNFS